MSLRTVQFLPRHTKLECTVRYLGREVEDTREISEQTELWHPTPVRGLLSVPLRSSKVPLLVTATLRCRRPTGKDDFLG